MDGDLGSAIDGYWVHPNRLAISALKNAMSREERLVRSRAPREYIPMQRRKHFYSDNGTFVCVFSISQPSLSGNMPFKFVLDKNWVTSCCDVLMTEKMTHCERLKRDFLYSERKIRCNDKIVAFWQRRRLLCAWLVDPPHTQETCASPLSCFSFS
jgi:hypothetical protein